MARFSYLSIALSILSSCIPHSRGFSTSRLLSSAAVNNHIFRRKNRYTLSGRESQGRYSDGRCLVRHVVTDQTEFISHSDEDGGRSYDFISVEEAEEALREERARYEGERSELEWLLEIQRLQLQSLANGQIEEQNAGDKNHESRARSSSNDAKSSSRILILGGHGHRDANTKNSGKKNRNKANRRGFRNKTNRKYHNDSNGSDDTYSKMHELEFLLQDAVIENEKLTRRLHEQRYQYDVERSLFEDELREGRSRLNCVRDELHMERAYFETSRRMLQQLVQEERQKVQQLEKELTMMMISRGELLSRQEQSEDEYQEQQHQKYPQTQHMQQEQSYNRVNDANSYHQQKRRENAQPDFTMNINDVQCPLYP